MSEDGTMATILIVEDDKFLSRALADGLVNAGFKVVVAYNGEEGLEKIVSEKPNIILLDIIMPKKNGFEMLEDMKLKNIGTGIPVFVLSNLGQDDDVKKGKELGAVDYIVKANLSIKNIVEKIKATLASVNTNSVKPAKPSSESVQPVPESADEIQQPASVSPEPPSVEQSTTESEPVVTDRTEKEQT